jgi:hypothetical protein
MNRSGLLAWLVLVGGLGVWGCTTYYTDPEALQSFQVSISKGGQGGGTAELRLPFIAGTSCRTQVCPDEETCIGYCSLAGTACVVDEDCPGTDLCNRLCARPVLLDIQTMGSEGGAYTPARDSLWVDLSVHPGFVPPPWSKAELKKGKASKVLTYIARAIGESYVWVEDRGNAPPGDEAYGQCNDDLDNDEDGLKDLADPDCLSASDNLEWPSSWATGMSPAFWFETPKVRHLQYTDTVSTSPLQDNSIYVNSGKLVVTNISNGGFFVTDLTDHVASLPGGQPGYFNSLFLYTFNQPDGVRYGDVLCSFSGGVVDYQGNTQVKYPDFEVMELKAAWDLNGEPVLGQDGEQLQVLCSDRTAVSDDAKLVVPAPVDVTALLTAEHPGTGTYTTELMANAKTMEPLESGLVTVKSLSMSTRFLACDADGNGDADSGDEKLCRDECQNDPACTQLESYFEYQQVAVYAALGKKFYMAQEVLKELSPLELAYIGQQDQSKRCLEYQDPVSGETLANPHKVLIGETKFLEYLCPPMELESVSGNYRHIYMCPPKPGKPESCGLQLFMLIPRFQKDVVVKEEKAR